MHPRRIASTHSCYGGGGLASLPSYDSLHSRGAESIRSEPPGGAVMHCQSFEDVQSTPGRGYGRDQEACPCPNPLGPPLAASSCYGDHPADATFTTERHGTHAFALNETYEAGPFALNETFTVDNPQCVPGPSQCQHQHQQNIANRTAQFDNRRHEHLQPVMQGPCPLDPQEMGAHSTPGMHTVARVDRYAHSSPGAGYAPCTPRTPIPPGFERPPQPCPPGGSPGSSWSSGYGESHGSTSGSSSSSSACPAPGFHPHLGQQYPPQPCPPGAGGVGFFLPMSPPAQQPQVPPPVAWDIPWNPPPQQIPEPCGSQQRGQHQHQSGGWSGSPSGSESSGHRTPLQPQQLHQTCPPPSPQPCPHHCPSPQPGPSGLQQAEGPPQYPSPQPGPSGLQQHHECPSRPPPCQPGPSQPQPSEQCPPPEGTDMVRPIMQGILRMVDFGHETINERTQHIQEIRDIVMRMQGTQEDALERLEQFRRLATNLLEGYLRRTTDSWNALGDHYWDVVRMAENVEGGPYPRLQGIENTEVVCQDEYQQLVRRAAVLARTIERELCSDTTSIGQLVNIYDSIEGELNTCQDFVPNFLKYMALAKERSRVIERFLCTAQCEFDRFMTEWRGDDVQGQLPEPPLSEEQCENLALQVADFRSAAVEDQSLVSTESPTPPTSPRRATWSPVVSPIGRELQRTPPCLPGRMQTWMRDASPSRLPPENLPYLQSIFTDYDSIEEQAVSEVQHSSNENQSLNESMNAMG